ncbi:unnamed protein product [Dovyalis caffra]|uniref:Uncharacterized protein n=1 Tax=Dovyalis caffra TaxID=77055 RepID=A0AAV1RQ09_9ROSI|nr:unnamed protein product [Dovyalis caffra]
MASKSVPLFPFLLLLLLLLQTLTPTHQFEIPMGPRDEYFITFNPSGTYVEVDVKNITKSLWDAGYKIASLVLENQLVKIVPFGSGGRFIYDPNDTDTVKIFNNNTVTIFAPPDEAFRFESWIILDYQFVTSKVDKEAFDTGSISEGSKLLTCDLHYDLTVSEVPDTVTGAYPCINNVTITQWDIYNDGHILVHGVENFFNPRYKVNSPRVGQDIAVI